MGFICLYHFLAQPLLTGHTIKSKLLSPTPRPLPPGSTPLFQPRLLPLPYMIPPSAVKIAKSLSPNSTCCFPLRTPAATVPLIFTIFVLSASPPLLFAEPHQASFHHILVPDQCISISLHSASLTWAWQIIQCPWSTL